MMTTLAKKKSADEYPVNQLIGHNLKCFRKSRGVTLDTLARAVGLTYQQLHKYEKGTNRLKVDLMVDIAEFFNIDPAELMSYLLLQDPASSFGRRSFLSDEALELLSVFEQIKNRDIRKNVINVIKGLS